MHERRVREEGEGADRWGRASRERSGCERGLTWRGSGAFAGPGELCWAARGEREGRKGERLGCWVAGKGEGEGKLGLRGRGWAGLVWGFGLVTGFGFLSFLFLSSFSNKLKPHSNLIEFKPNLNSNPMHSTN